MLILKIVWRKSIASLHRLTQAVQSANLLRTVGDLTWVFWKRKGYRLVDTPWDTYQHYVFMFDTIFFILHIIVFLLHGWHCTLLICTCIWKRYLFSTSRLTMYLICSSPVTQKSQSKTAQRSQNFHEDVTFSPVLYTVGL